MNKILSRAVNRLRRNFGDNTSRLLIGISAALCCGLLCWPLKGGAQYFSLPATVSYDEQHRLMNEVFIIPDANSIAFNPEVWKKDVKSRRNMLFALFHNDAIKDRKVLQERLGRPSEVQTSDKYVTWTYELGLQNGHYTFFQVVFDSGRPSSMRISQKYLDVHPQLTSEWIVKNQDWEGLAEDYNRKFFIVGMPVSIINHWWLRTEKHEVSEPDGHVEKVDVCEPFQFQYFADRSKVKRFRMTYETASGKNGITDWQEVDLRKDPRCLVEVRDYQERHPVRIVQRFDSAVWKDRDTGLFRQNARSAMVESLIRSYPLIGMSRDEAFLLLGKGQFRQCTKIEEQNDPYLRDVEFYQLTFPMCGNAGCSVFQLSYNQDRIVAYRVVHLDGIGSSDHSFGPLFNIDSQR